ncbi:MAG: NACHT domain-containing protein, partial [Bradyrhizobium sp.]
MSKQSTTTKASGGGGYSFADKVAAGFLAQMLKRKFPLEPDLGVIAELHFETRDIGHVLDDLMLVLKRGLDVTNCFVSVKSNRQLTKEGFNKEFVQDAWNEWKGSSGSAFDRSRDILGLIVGQIDDLTLQEWQTLQKQASSTTPERLSARLQGDSKSSNKVQRAIFEGLGQSADREMDAAETARLVARVRVLRFSDANEGDFINLCAEIVRGGRLEEGAKLWARLVQLASENRATGGYFDLPKLIQVLRPDFDLQDHPDLRADVSKLDAVSSGNISGVRDVIGTATRLARSDEKVRLSSDIKAHDVIVVSGESGSGKSTMLSQLVGTGGAFKRTLWLTAEQLSKTSQVELANALGLTRSIPELIRMATTHPAVLVVDGFERFEGEARKRAGELLRAVREEGFVGWKILMTCQPQSLNAAHDFLVEAGITDVHKFDFEKPALAEIREALESDSAIRPLLLRAELQPILRNLMVLDWVFRADVAQSLSTSDRVGVADVIDHIWERWTGTGNERLARDGLLRTLGEREGKKLSGAVEVDAIAAHDLRLVEELGREGVLRVRPPSVQFSHDLIGDWARYRILKFAGANATAMIKTVAKVPRWGRAIRLYAQSLAEHGHGLNEWKATTVDLAGDDADSKLASDFFLDGLLFAVNSESLLEQVWSDVVANGGQILHRLLNRLLHVATFPDWRLMGIGDARTAEYTEARFRIPQPLFWIPVLRVLNRHSADVAAHALLQAAEVCALWLRTMPVGMFGRREATSLAIELAKEAQGRAAEGLHLGDKDKVVYEAMLSGAPEFPDEVAQIALELCGRKDEPAHAIKRRDEEQERQYRLQQEWRKKNPEKKRVKSSPVFVPSSHRDGPIRPAASDGPTREVAEGFQAALMDTQALGGLISVRPEVAREVLLAVCIEEPTPTDPYDNDRWMGLDLGLADWRQGYPAMYWKGGFLRFLQQAPKQGLDAIVRLVNYATLRWLENGLRREPTEADREKFGFDFQINEKKVNWVGDCNVFAWHRQLPMDGDTIECALGALEKWLYDEIEKGNDVSEWLQFILEHSESAAFAGLLISVGLKYHGLFAGQLQPLLGNYYVYQCQASLAQSEQSETWRISLAQQPQEIVKLEAEWNRMPHRRWLLWDVASGIMLQHKGTAEFLSACKVEWAKLPEPHENSRMEKQFLLARFDPANYSETPHEDGGVLISMRWPDHLQAVVEASQNDRNLRQLALTLALFARQLLEGQKSLTEDRLAEFVEQIRKLAEWKDSGDDALPEHYRISSIAGGLAVLLIEHRDWLRKNPETEA